jgi:hypothetical protein
MIKKKKIELIYVKKKRNREMKYLQHVEVEGYDDEDH